MFKKRPTEEEFRKFVANKMQSEYILFGSVKKVDGNDITHTITLCNSKCHEISVDNAINDKKYKVVLCYCVNKINNSNGFIHFINYNYETNQYLDNTLGGVKRNYNYYILDSSWIPLFLEQNNNDARAMLNEAKQQIFNYYSSFFKDKNLKHLEYDIM